MSVRTWTQLKPVLRFPVPTAPLCVQPASASARDDGRQLQRRGRERTGALRVRERRQTRPDDGAAGAGV